jgi:hypothetical protein
MFYSLSPHVSQVIYCPKMGWELRGGITYSPLIGQWIHSSSSATVWISRAMTNGMCLRAHAILAGCTTATTSNFCPGRSEILVFVNSPAFVLRDSEPYLPGILDTFWNQLKMTEPGGAPFDRG